MILVAKSVDVPLRYKQHIYCAVWSCGNNSYTNTTFNLIAVSLSTLIRSVDVVCVEDEGFIIAH